MDIYEKFRKNFRTTRECVKTSNVDSAVSGCHDLIALVRTQYSLETGLKNKSRWKIYEEEFTNCVYQMQNDGFINNSVRRYFGLPLLAESVPVISDDPKKSRDMDINEELLPTPKKEDNYDPMDALKMNRNKSKQDNNDLDSDGKTDGEDKNDNVVADDSKKKDNISGKGTISETSFDPETLDDFIGQDNVIKIIREELNAAKKQRNSYIDHILLFGNSGLGKTTLMKLIATELNVKFEHLDCSQFRNDVKSHNAIQNFFQRISNEKVPVVIGMDEIHSLPERLQTGLLTLLNERKFIFMDNNGVNHVFPVDNFTFIGATTDEHDVLPTIKNRCALQFLLKDYSKDELHLIFRNKFAAIKLRIEEDALCECVNRCRNSIRETNSIVKRLNTLAINADTDMVDKKMALEYFQIAEIDPIGLKSKDLEILNVLNEDKSGVMAGETIAARVGLDAKKYQSEYEVYLIKIGFICITGRGRSLTQKAREYLESG